MVNETETLDVEVKNSDIIVKGCTDPKATNYNPDATVDDGSCEYNPEQSDVKEIDVDVAEEIDLNEFAAFNSFTDKLQASDNIVFQDEDNREHNVDKAKIKSFLEKYPNAHSVDAFGGWNEITFTTSNGKEWNVGKNNRKDFKRLFPDAYSINEYDGYNPQVYVVENDQGDIIEYNVGFVERKTFTHNHPTAVPKSEYTKSDPIITEEIDSKNQTINDIDVEDSKLLNEEVVVKTQEVETEVKEKVKEEVITPTVDIDTDEFAGVSGVRRIWTDKQGVEHRVHVNLQDEFKKKYPDATSPDEFASISGVHHVFVNDAGEEHRVHVSNIKKYKDRYPTGYNLNEFGGRGSQQAYIDEKGREHNVLDTRVSDFKKRYPKAVNVNKKLEHVTEGTIQYNALKKIQLEKGIRRKEENINDVDGPVLSHNEILVKNTDVISETADFNKIDLIVNKKIKNALNDVEDIESFQLREELFKILSDNNFVVGEDREGNFIPFHKLNQEDVDSYLEENPNLVFTPVGVGRANSYVKFLKNDELAYYYAGNKETLNFVYDKKSDVTTKLDPELLSITGEHVTGVMNEFLDEDDPNSNSISLHPEYPISPYNNLLHPDGNNFLRIKGYNNNEKYNNPILFEYEWTEKGYWGDKGERIVQRCDFDNPKSVKTFNNWFEKNKNKIKLIGIPNAENHEANNTGRVIKSEIDGYYYLEEHIGTDKDGDRKYRVSPGKKVKVYKDREYIYEHQDYSFQQSNQINFSTNDLNAESVTLFHYTDYDNSKYTDHNITFQDNGRGVDITNALEEGYDLEIIPINPGIATNIGDGYEHLEFMSGFQQYLLDEHNIKVNDNEFNTEWGYETSLMWGKYAENFIDSGAYKNPKYISQNNQLMSRLIDNTEANNIYADHVRLGDGKGLFYAGKADPVMIHNAYYDPMQNQNLIAYEDIDKYDYKLVHSDAGNYYQPEVKEEYKGLIYDIALINQRNNGELAWAYDYDISDLKKMRSVIQEQLSNLYVNHEINPSRTETNPHLDPSQLPLDILDPRFEGQSLEYKEAAKVLNETEERLRAYNNVLDAVTIGGKGQKLNTSKIAGGIRIKMADDTYETLSLDLIGEYNITGSNRLGFDMVDYENELMQEMQKHLDEETMPLLDQMLRNFYTDKELQVIQIDGDIVEEFSEKHSEKILEIENKLIEDLNVRWENGEFESTQHVQAEFSKLRAEALDKQLNYNNFYKTRYDKRVGELFENYTAALEDVWVQEQTKIIDKFRPETNYISSREYRAYDKALEDLGFYTATGEDKKIILDRLFRHTMGNLGISVGSIQGLERAREFYFYYYDQLAYTPLKKGDVDEVPSWFALHDMAENIAREMGMDIHTENKWNGSAWGKYSSQGSGSFEKKVDWYFDRWYGAAAVKTKRKLGRFLGDHRKTSGSGPNQEYGDKTVIRTGSNNNAVIKQKEYYQLYHTQQFVQEVFKIDEETIKDNTAWANFVLGLSDRKPVEFWPILSSIYNWDKSAEINKVINGIGDNPRPDEQAFLDIMTIGSYIDQRKSAMSRSYRVGDMVGSAVPVMVEFALSRGWFKVGSSTMRNRLINNMTKTITATTKSGLSKFKDFKIVTSKTPGAVQVSQGALKGKYVLPVGKTAQAIETQSFLAGVTMQSVHPAHYAKIGAGTVERMTPQVQFMMSDEGGEFMARIIDDSGDSFEKAFLEATGENWITVMSENIGAYLPGFKNASWAPKQLKQSKEWLKRTVLVRYLTRKFPNVKSNFASITDRVQWNGIPQEVWEEIIELPLQNLLEGNHPGEGLDLDFVTDVTATSTIMWGGFSGGAIISSSFRKKPKWEINGKKYNNFNDFRDEFIKLKTEGNLPDAKIIIDGNRPTFNWAKVQLESEGIEVLDDHLNPDQVLSSSTENKEKIRDQIIESEDNQRQEQEFKDQISANEMEIISELDEVDAKKVEEIEGKLETIENEIKDIQEDLQKPEEIKDNELEKIKVEKTKLVEEKNTIIQDKVEKIVEKRNVEQLKENVQNTKDAIGPTLKGTIFENTEVVTTEDVVQENQKDPNKKDLNEQEALETVMREENQEDLDNLNLELEETQNNIKEAERILKEEDLTKKQIEKVNKDIETLKANQQTVQGDINIIEGNIKTAWDGSHGFMVTNPKSPQYGNIIINSRVAGKKGSHGNMNVAGHEFLHAVMYKTFSDNPHMKVAMGQALQNYIYKIDPTQVKNSEFAKRLDLYRDGTINGEVKTFEESLNLLSDALANGDLEFNESLLGKVGRTFKRVFKKQNVGIEFESGKDVFNFIKEYNESIRTGVISQRVAEVARKGAVLKGPLARQAELQKERLAGYQKEGVKFSMIYQEVENMYKDFSVGWGDPVTRSRAASIMAYTLENEVNRRLKGLKGFSESDKADITLEFITSDSNRGLRKLIEKYDENINDSVMGYLNARVPGTKRSLLDVRLQEFYEKDPKYGQIIKSLEEKGVTRAVEKMVDKELTAEELVDIELKKKAKPKLKPKVLTDLFVRTDANLKSKVNEINKEIKSKILDGDKIIVGTNKKGESIVKDLNNLNYKTLEDVTPQLTIELFVGKDTKYDKGKNKGQLIAPRIASVLKVGDLNSSDIIAVQRFIKRHGQELLAMLPEGHIGEPTFEATGVQNVLLEEFYNKRSIRAKTGPGPSIQIKKPIINVTEFKRAFGITPRGQDDIVRVKDLKSKDGKVIEKGKSQIIKGLIMQTGKIMTNQAVRDHYDKKNDKSGTIRHLGEGKSQYMFSRTYQVKPTIDQKVIILEAFMDNNFGERYKYLEKKVKNPVGVYLRDYFKQTKEADKESILHTQPIDNSILMKIGKDFSKNLNIIETKFKPSEKNFNTIDYLRAKVARSFLIPNELDAIELAHGLPITKEKGASRGYIMKGREVHLEIARKFGEKADNRFYRGGHTNPARLYNFTTPKDYKIENFDITNDKGVTLTVGKAARPSFIRNTQDLKDNFHADVLVQQAKDIDLDNLNLELEETQNNIKEAERILKEEDLTKKQIEKVNKDIETLKAKLFNWPQSPKGRRLADATDPKWFTSPAYIKMNETEKLEFQNKLYKSGEADKAQLIKTITFLNDQHMNEKLDHVHIRTFIDAQSGSMTGLIKSSASLNTVPEESVQELIERYGDKFRLEHTTPAKDIKSYIYDYILEKDPGLKKIKKQRMDDAIKNYHTAIIPVSLDDIVNTIYPESLPPETIPGDTDMYRYYNPIFGDAFDISLVNFVTGKKHAPIRDISHKEIQERYRRINEYNNKLLPKNLQFNIKKENPLGSEILKRTNTLVDAINFSRSVNNPKKGISVWDFDDTLAKTKSNVLFTRPDGTKGKLNAEEYASQYVGLLEQGYEFDFSEFNIVVDPTIGPFFKKFQDRINKFGVKDNFILTARPAESALAIKEFLSSQGLNIPIKNITGLANSTSEAKAMWIAEKVGEGYNDFYFADDALQNVQAVDNMLEQFDVKRKVQQARYKFSKSLDKEFNNILKDGKKTNKKFNDILEETTGIGSKKVFSDAVAKLRGKGKGRFKFFIPPSAEDFSGLLYNFLGKGKLGEEQMRFFKKALFDPFSRGISEMNSVRQNLANNYRDLRKDFKHVKTNKKVPGTAFTQDQAIRVYLWNKAGFEIEGLSKRDITKLSKTVEKDPTLKGYAERLSLISKQKEGYTKPGKNWLVENISLDLHNITHKVSRPEFLNEWIENKNIIFSKENLNKIEAIYGSNFREALEDILYRMEKGTNRTYGNNRLLNMYTNWVNNSVGAIMFFNMRSAVLQTISSVNYINWNDNNPLKAAAAFANQPQYWKDFAYIFNSDMLKQRRAGLKYNVNEAELAEAVKGSNNKAKAALNWLLRKGFTPTQIADSFAIASGGATMYRNRVNTYKKTMPIKEAEAKAWLDFQEITEVSQQSSRPDLISQQQANPLGRILLAFANTPMQYARLIKKSIRDLINNRGDAKTNISKIIYYGAVQSFIFAGLQQALFAVIGSDDEEEIDKKQTNVVNTMFDSLLRGMGYGGSAVSTIKNTIMEYFEQEEYAKDDKFFTEPDHAYTIIQALNFSPPIGSKIRKIYSGLQTQEFNRDVIKEMSLLDIDNPIYSTIANITSATTNIPLDRVLNKIDNMQTAVNGNIEMWQRVALAMGWNRWNLGIEDEKIEKIKEEIKEEKKLIKKQEKLEKKYPGKSEQEIKIIQKSKEVFDLNKQQQVEILKNLGLSDQEIKDLKLEQNRVDKIMEMYDDNTKEIEKALADKDKKKHKDIVTIDVPKDLKESITKENQLYIERTINIIKDRAYGLNKSEQVKILKSFDLDPNKYKKEEDRVNKILEIYKDNPNKIDSSITAIENYVPTKIEQRSIDLFKMNKNDQVNLLMELGLSSRKIKGLKYEEDRVNMIIKLQDKKKKK